MHIILENEGDDNEEEIDSKIWEQNIWLSSIVITNQPHFLHSLLHQLPIDHHGLKRFVIIKDVPQVTSAHDDSDDFMK